MEFINPTLEVCEAINNLRLSDDWKTFLSWLEDNGVSQDTRLRVTEGVEVHRCQGAAQFATFLLEEIAKSPETYVKLKNVKLHQAARDKEQYTLNKTVESLHRTRPR